MTHHPGGEHRRHRDLPRHPPLAAARPDEHVETAEPWLSDDEIIVLHDALVAGYGREPRDSELDSLGRWATSTTIRAILLDGVLTGLYAVRLRGTEPEFIPRGESQSPDVPS